MSARVVKGVSRRVVIVEPPEPWIFEQAIFIVREDAPLSGEETKAELLRQARREAAEYVAAALPERGETGHTCIRRLISRLRRTMMRFSSRLI